MTRYGLYVITDEKVSGGRSHAEIARAVAHAGADVIQLRDKGLSGEELAETARQLRAITHEAGVLLLVNDSLEAALESGADGVHLGQTDLPLREARSMAPPGFIIGVSVGNAEEALEAEEEGADYVGLGPIYPTGSKDDAGPACGLKALREVKAAVGIPVVAIGGITKANAAETLRNGADGLAVISAVLAQPDMAGAARELAEAIAQARPGSG